MSDRINEEAGATETSFPSYHHSSFLFYSFSSPSSLSSFSSHSSYSYSSSSFSSSTFFHCSSIYSTCLSSSSSSSSSSPSSALLPPSPVPLRHSLKGELTSSVVAASAAAAAVHSTGFHSRPPLPWKRGRRAGRTSVGTWCSSRSRA